MPLIHMVGPNAIGKSTAAKRWKERYGDSLLVVSADGGTNDMTTIAGIDLKGTVEDKRKAVEYLRSMPVVSMCESVRTTTINYATPSETVILVTCDGPTLKRHLQSRCAAKGKTFNEAYWDKWKCDYESHRRYLNLAAKKLRPEQVKHFVIGDQARDWEAVDEYFSRVFCRLHNQLMRGRVS